MNTEQNPFIPQSVDGVAYYELVDGPWNDPNLEIESWGDENWLD